MAITLSTRLSRLPILGGDVTGATSNCTQVAITKCKGPGEHMTDGRKKLAYFRLATRKAVFKGSGTPGFTYKANPDLTHQQNIGMLWQVPQEANVYTLALQVEMPCSTDTIGYNSSRSRVDPWTPQYPGWCVSNILLPTSKERS